MRILVVEDESIQQEAARLQLKDHEIEVMAYFQLHQMGEEEGRRQLTDFVSSFDVLLTDLFMPAPERNQPDMVVKAPVGWCVLLLGLDCGVKKIGLCTDMHRHINVVSYALDMMITNMLPDKAHTIVVGDTKIAILNCDLTLVYGMNVEMKYVGWDEVPVLEALSSSYSPDEKEALIELVDRADEERKASIEDGEEEPVMDGPMMPSVKDWRYLLEVLLE